MVPAAASAFPHGASFTFGDVAISNAELNLNADNQRA
jgi:hypothetical protein